MDNEGWLFTSEELEDLEQQAAQDRAFDLEAEDD